METPLTGILGVTVKNQGQFFCVSKLKARSGGDCGFTESVQVPSDLLSDDQILISGMFDL